MVEIPDDVAKQVAEFLRSTEGHPDDNAAAERWADLLDPQPPTLREQVARAIDRCWENAGSTRQEDADVPALVAALREARAEVERTRASLGGMVEWLAEVVVDTRDALRAGGCAEHFLTAEQVGALEAATRILSRERNADPSRYDLAVAERDDWRRRYEALRDGVTGLCDERENDPYRGVMFGGEPFPARVGTSDLRAVVTHVEGDEGA